MLEKVHGYRVCFSHRPAVGRDGYVGVGLYKTGFACREPVMISLDVIYGFGGLCALMLLAYLAYALICAEEF